MKKIIHTTEAPAAIGPYSQAVLVNNMLFVSGQVPLDPETSKLVAGDIRLQTERVLDNMEAVLKSAGFSLADVVKTTVYLLDLSDFQEMNDVYAQYFNEKPARSTVEVSRLPKNVKVEIEAIAVK